MMASVPMVAILYFCHEIMYCTRLVLHRHHMKFLKFGTRTTQWLNVTKILINLFAYLFSWSCQNNSIYQHNLMALFYVSVNWWLNQYNLTCAFSYNFLTGWGLGWTFIFTLFLFLLFTLPYYFLKMSSHCMDLYKQTWENSYLFS